MLRILISSFMIYSLLFQPTAAVLPPEQAIGLSIPFKACKKLHLSPVEGMDNLDITGLRYHGNFGTPLKGKNVAEDLPRIPYRGFQEDLAPLDPFANLIHWVFPAHTPGLLATNNLGTTPIHLWLTPEKIGQLIAIIDDQVALKRKDSGKLLKDIEGIITPATWGKKVKGKQKDIFEKNTRDFARVVSASITYAIDFDYSASPFYFPHIVERVLLTYMAMSVSDQEELQPYYDILRTKGVVPASPKEDLQSIFRESNYRNLMGRVQLGFIEADEPPQIAGLDPITPHLLAGDPERLFLLRFGHEEFESSRLLPPNTPYREACYTEKKTYSFSNCVEAALLNTLLAFTYNPQTRRFSTTPFREELLAVGGQFMEGLDEFLEPLTPSTIQLTGTHDAWTQLVSNINNRKHRGAVLSPVRRVTYKKSRGQGVKGPAANYEIKAGPINFIRVLGVMLGYPTNWNNMNGSADETVSALGENLDLVCSLFSNGRKIGWHAINAAGKRIEGFPDPHKVNVVFKFDREEQFRVMIEPGHAEFFHCGENTANQLWELGKIMTKQAFRWSPFLYPFLPHWGGLEELEMQLGSNDYRTFLKGWLLTGDTSSIAGRRDIVSDISRYKKRTKKNDFDGWIFRWFNSNGEKFANWDDDYTNRHLIKDLGLFMKPKEILDFFGGGVFRKLFTTDDDDELARKFMNSIKPSDIRDTTLAKIILSYSDNLRRLMGVSLYPASDSDSSSEEYDSDSSESGEESSSTNSSETGKGFCLLPILAREGFSEFIEAAHQIDPNGFKEALNTHFTFSTFPKTGERGTLFELAIGKNHWETAHKLYTLGATVNKEAFIKQRAAEPRPAENEIPFIIPLFKAAGLSVSKSFFYFVSDIELQICIEKYPEEAHSALMDALNWNETDQIERFKQAGLRLDCLAPQKF